MLISSSQPGFTSISSKSQLPRFRGQQDERSSATPTGNTSNEATEPHKPLPPFSIAYSCDTDEDTNSQSNSPRPIIVLHPQTSDDEPNNRAYEFSTLQLSPMSPTTEAPTPLVFTPLPANPSPPRVNRWDAAFITSSLAGLGGGIPLLVRGFQNTTNTGGALSIAVGEILTLVGGVSSMLSIGWAAVKMARQRREAQPATLPEPDAQV